MVRRDNQEEAKILVYVAGVTSFRQIGKTTIESSLAASVDSALDRRKTSLEEYRLRRFPTGSPFDGQIYRQANLRKLVVSEIPIFIRSRPVKL